MALTGHWRAASRNLSFELRPASGQELTRSKSFQCYVIPPPVEEEGWIRKTLRRRSPWLSYKTFGKIFIKMRVVRISRNTAVMLAVILVIVVGTIRLIGSNANNVFSQVGSSIQ